jgi:hypothetical protein
MLVHSRGGEDGEQAIPFALPTSAFSQVPLPGALRVLCSLLRGDCRPSEEPDARGLCESCRNPARLRFYARRTLCPGLWWYTSRSAGARTGETLQSNVQRVDRDLPFHEC